MIRLFLVCELQCACYPFLPFSGKRINRGDDRLSSTAMAVNALFYIWGNINRRGLLLPDTPDAVKDALMKSCRWLTLEALGGRLERMNAFFSGSVKLGSVVSEYFYVQPYTLLAVHTRDVSCTIIIYCSCIIILYFAGHSFLLSFELY